MFGCVWAETPNHLEKKFGIKIKYGITPDNVVHKTLNGPKLNQNFVK